VFAFIGGIGIPELVVVALLAVLIFGRRLPEVAGQVASHAMKAKRAFTDLRRETGIDEELRRVREEMDAGPRSASWEPVKPREIPEGAMPRGSMQADEPESSPEGATTEPAEETPPEDPGEWSRPGS
jgi:sec-independent protein translocase protein TatA